MDLNALCKTINFEKHYFSLLLASPKPNLLEWLNEHVKRKRLEKYCMYSPEENLVVIIPKIDFFTEIGSYERFLTHLKPRLLRVELERFGATEQDIGRPLSKESFDEFFEISLRDGAMLLNDFKGLVFPT